GDSRPTLGILSVKGYKRDRAVLERFALELHGAGNRHPPAVRVGTAGQEDSPQGNEGAAEECVRGEHYRPLRAWFASPALESPVVGNVIPRRQDSQRKNEKK